MCIKMTQKLNKAQIVRIRFMAHINNCIKTSSDILKFKIDRNIF